MTTDITSAFDDSRLYDANSHLSFRLYSVAVLSELREALLAVRPSCRGELCWCEQGWDTTDGTHSYACQSVSAAIEKSGSLFSHVSDVDAGIGGGMPFDGWQACYKEYHSKRCFERSEL